ncbi:hypothetical protein EU528_11335 [Candidatus Thorarchaeota archaeon]|nr:MAG: hypothetical protein EU528_11335 [Candidatus Thorarchaeota archaeon]
MKNIIGEIVASQTAKLQTGQSYGYITIETPAKEHLRLKVGAHTKYDTLERGDKVEIKYSKLGNTDILSAKEILKQS